VLGRPVVNNLNQVKVDIDEVTSVRPVKRAHSKHFTEWEKTLLFSFKDLNFKEHNSMLKLHCEVFPKVKPELEKH
jgi:hypothetical protein